LDKILKLIGDCEYSIHDLSRVELGPQEALHAPFNMPFELGLTVAQQKHKKKESWYVFESNKLPHGEIAQRPEWHGCEDS